MSSAPVTPARRRPTTWLAVMVAGLAVKLWVNGDTALVICRTALARDLDERL